jgi:ADP-heptose:LPS heptosyltransferase
VTRVLATRTDGMGDVLLTGPAVRAVAATGARVTMLAGPAGAAAAARLPGVAEVRVARLPWIDAHPDVVTRAGFGGLVDAITSGDFDAAVVFTSFHQSPLPLALACRLAGVRLVGAISEDYPGALLDVRHRVPDDVHEVERNLSLVAACGMPLPAGDDARLAIVPPATAPATPPALRPRFVAVHPGASAPARTLAPARWRAAVGSLAAAGFGVVVTGGPDERALTRAVCRGMPASVVDAGGTDFDTMARIVAAADAIAAGNTGPAHLAAAVGTPVVSVFAPTVPAARWRPWKVPHVLLGTQDIACRGCRARTCPLDVQRCLATVVPSDIVAAVARLAEAAAVAV